MNQTSSGSTLLPLPPSSTKATTTISNSSSTSKKWRVVMTSVFIGVCLFIGCYVTATTTSKHFDHGMERVLLSIQHAPGIKLTFQARAGSINHQQQHETQMIVHGVVFPHTNTDQEEEEDALAFDGRLSYTHDGHLFNYTLIEGRGYMTIQNVATRQVITTACLEASTLPPIHDISKAMKTARVIEQVPSRQSISCEGKDAKLVEFFFANEPYVVCTRGHQEDHKIAPSIDTIHGEDLFGSMDFLSPSSEEIFLQTILPPSSNLNLDLTKCPLLLTNPSKTTTRALMSEMAAQVQTKMTDTYKVIQGQPRSSVLGSDSCDQCKDGMKACLFLHGLGNSLDAGIQDDYVEYFGNIQKHLPCCHTVKFLLQDTDHNPWYEDKLPRQVCDAALKMSSNDYSTELEDIVLIAHSMGNLVITSAIMKNYCTLGKSSKWIALEGPIEGSMSSTRATEICVDNPDTKWDDPLLSLLHSVGLCPSKDGVRSLSYINYPKTSKQLRDLYTHAMFIYRTQVHANLCGISPQGLVSLESAKFLALSIFSQHPIPQNDGAVDFNSCRGPLDASLYSKSWKQTNFYKADVNHADGALRNGDGWWGESRRPIKWLQCQF